MTNAVIYARYSSSSQDEQTIEMQLKKCHEYAKANKLNVIKEYTDEAKTGRNGNRNGLQKLLEDSKKHTFQVVIMYMSDRFFRDTAGALEYEKELNDNGVFISYTYEKFDDSPFGKYMKTMSYANAQLYSDMYSVRIRDGLERNAKNYKTRGSNIPFGYVSKDKDIVIDETKVQYVKMIFEMYASGKKYVDIYNQLNALGVKTKRGREFNKSSIGRILQNKMYIGTYVYKDIETPNVVPRIINDDLFNKVQNMLVKTKKAPAMKRAKEEYVLSSKTYCGFCHEKMVGQSGTSETKKVYKYYKCKSALHHSKCPGKLKVSKDYLEDKVFNEVVKFVNEKTIDSVIKRIIERTNANQDTNSIKVLCRALEDNVRKKNNLIEAISDCDDKEARMSFYKKLKELDEHKILLDNKLDEERKKHILLTEEQIRSYLLRIKKNCSIKNKRLIVNALVNQIVVMKDYAVLMLNITDLGIVIPLNECNGFFKKGSSHNVPNAPPKRVKELEKSSFLCYHECVKGT